MKIPSNQNSKKTTSILILDEIVEEKNLIQKPEQQQIQTQKQQLIHKKKNPDLKTTI